jgi:methyltransferase
VTAERLYKVILGRLNARRLIAGGAIEHPGKHYWAILALHASWLAALWRWVPGREVIVPPLVALALLQPVPLWIIAALGRRWTTRIIVLPDAPLVRTGPYRIFDYPSYLVVALEVPFLALAFGLGRIAAVFGAINAALLLVRTRAEDRALRPDG